MNDNKRLSGAGRLQPRLPTLISFVLLVSLLIPRTAAALPAGFQEYYVLGNEEQLYNMFDAIDSAESGDPGGISSNLMHSVVTMVATTDNQVVYYDHWEDGYEVDLLSPTQGTTEVYGDGDTGNGGTGSDILLAGDILNLSSSDPVALYDFGSGAGSDKWAWGTELGAAPPPTTSTVPATELNSTEYTEISISDNSRYAAGDAGFGDYAAIRFRVTISETASNIDQLRLLFEGYGGNSSIQVGLWVWNYNTSAYEQLAQDAQFGYEIELTGSITTSISDYLDSNGYLTFLAADVTASENLRCDYVRVEVVLKPDVAGITYLVPVNLRGTYLRYDGGDHVITSGGPVDLAHAMWPQDGTWIGGAWEVYSLQAWEDSYSYSIPIGVDTSSGDFKYVWIEVEALYDNTTVTIDNGTSSIDVHLDRGETYSSMGYVDSQSSTPITITEGTTVCSDKQTQIALITGGAGTYQTRLFVMIPELMWGTEYFAAIPRPTDADPEAEVYLYNPHDYGITVEAHDLSGTDSITIAAGTVVSYSLQAGPIPGGSAVRLNSDDTFWGLVCADTADTSYDWGFSLIPTGYLMDNYYLSWAPGNVLDPVSSGTNASPAWVTPIADNTTFYVDYGPADGVVDETFTMDGLETRRIFDPDDDNTGMHIWATNKFVPNWGADPTSNQPYDGYLDLGYTVLPLHQSWLEPVLSVEKTSDTEVLPPEGGEVTFLLEVETDVAGPLTNVDITDTLPISWTYTSGSTIVTYPDGSKGYPEPTINGRNLFWDLSHEMDSNEILTLQFDAELQTAGSVGVLHTDGFESDDYSGGTSNWLSDWIESEGNGPSNGDIRIVGSDNVDPYSGSSQLRVVDDDQTIYREIDLSDFTRPTLRFKRSFWSLEGSEAFGVEISTSGVSYNTLISWTNPISQGVWVQEEVNLTPYITSTARIRFGGISGATADDYVYVDDVEVYDAAVVNENQGLVSGEYRGHIFNASDNAFVSLSLLSIEKAVDRSVVGIGETLLYTLTCQNSGGITTTGTYINDIVPWGTTFSSASSGGVYISATNTVSWTVGDVEPFGTSSVTFTVTVDNETPDGTSIENFGRVDSDQTELVNSNTVETTVLAPDLDVTKSGPANASEGSIITYTIQYVNNGGAAATGVVITDSIPTSTTYQSGSIAIDTGSGWVPLSDSSGDDAGTYDPVADAVVIEPGVVSGTVATGESGSIRFSVQISSSVPGDTTIVNCVTVNRDGANPWDTTLVATAISDLTIEKAADQETARAGDVIEYTLTYGNQGAITETNVYIYDTIPADSTYVSGTVTGADLTVEFSVDHRGTWTTTVPSDPSQATDLRWSRAELAPGEVDLAAGFHVELPEDMESGTTLSNYATITSTQAGSVNSNVVDVHTVDLVINKVASSFFAYPGDTITYTITYGNNGSADALGSTITDTLPISTSYVAGSIAGAGADDSGAPVLVWNVGTIDSVTGGLLASYAVMLDPGVVTGTNIVNTALVASSIDSETSQESTVTVAGNGLVIGPDNEAWGYPGQAITYCHSIVNTGSVTDTALITLSHSLWPAAATTLYHDDDGDCAHDPGELVITTTTEPLVAGEEYDMLLVLTIPGAASGGGVNYTTITATSTVSPALSSIAIDTTHVNLVALAIAKTPDIQTVSSGSTVTFTIAVTNTGEVDLDSVQITDVLEPTCAQTVGTLTAGADYSYACSTASVTADITNTAVVTGTPPFGADVTDSDTAFVDVTPTIVVTKTADPTIVGEPSGTVTFTVQVENTSSEEVTLTSLTDDIHGDLSSRGTCSIPYAIPIGNSYTCAFTATVYGTAGYSETDTVTAWAEDDEANTTSDNDTATVEITATLTSLTVITAGSGTVDVDPPAPHYYSDVVTLTANADPGWHFDSWSGDGSGSTNPLTVTMDTDKTITATFIQDEYTLTLNTVGSGSVVSDPIQSAYHYGDVVTLTANADAHYHFDSWSGDASGSTNPLTITMDTSKSVTATFVNDPPTISDISYQSIDEDTSTGPLAFAIGDTETPVDSLGLAKASSNTTLVPLANMVFGGSGITRTLTVTPVADLSGVALITVTVTDGGGLTTTDSFTLSVANTNDDPDAVDDTPTVPEDSTNNPLDLLSNDTYLPDPIETLTITDVGTPDQGGTAVNGTSVVTYTPAAHFYGTETFTYTISDGNGGFDTATVTVDVTNTNDDPDAVDDTPSVPEDSTNNPLDVLSNDTYLPDPVESLTITDVGTPDQGGTAVNGTTVVTYTPSADFYGTETFTYTIADGNGGFDTATVTVDVTNTNDDPDAVDDTPTVAEDSINNSLDLLTNDTYLPDPFESLTISDVGVPDQGGAVVNGTTVVTYTPAVDFYGAETFTYTISDGNGGFDTATVTVDVTNTNDDPDAVDDTPSVPEDSTDIPLDLLDNDTYLPDPFETLSITDVGIPDQGGAAVNGTSVVTYTPAAHFYGTETFTYTIADGNGGFDTATITVTVTPAGYTLTINTVGSGSVISDPVQSTYHSDDSVTLTATANPGWSFAGWSGDLVTTTSPATITMDTNKTVTATFTRDEYTLSVNIIGSGSVITEPAQAVYYYGDLVTLTAIPEVDWEFTDWSGDMITTTNPVTITMDSSLTIVATFSYVNGEPEEYYINLPLVLLGYTGSGSP